MWLQELLQQGAQGGPSYTEFTWHSLCAKCLTWDHPPSPWGNLPNKQRSCMLPGKQTNDHHGNAGESSLLGGARDQGDQRARSLCCAQLLPPPRPLPGKVSDAAAGVTQGSKTENLTSHPCLTAGKPFSLIEIVIKAGKEPGTGKWQNGLPLIRMAVCRLGEPRVQGSGGRGEA